MNILIADGDRQTRNMLAGAVTSCLAAKQLGDVDSLDVLEASSGDEMYELASEFQSDLIVANADLPRGGRTCACRHLRSNPALEHSYLIVSSRHRSESLVVRSLDSGADDVIHLPTSVEEFQARVRRGIRTSQERRSANIDWLTGLLNRSAMVSIAGREIARANRYSKPLAMMMIDLDRFKQINDYHGHEAGDHALVHVAETLRRCSRTIDYVARWGGDEFIMLMPETSIDGAETVARRIHDCLNTDCIQDLDAQLRVTASIGLAVLETDNMADFMRATDGLLYKAKGLGGNQCVTEPTDIGYSSISDSKRK